VRFQISLPTKPSLRPAGPLALSPDGHHLAFLATSTDGIRRIWIRALNLLDVRPLAGTEGAGTLLFWSPDSRFIAFDSGGKLERVDVSGGPAEPVCSLNLMGVGGSWNRDGVILFGQFGGPIMRVASAGGVATPLTVLDGAHGDVAHTNPRFLPDGTHFLYLRDNGTVGDISVGSLDVKPEAQDSRRLVEGVVGPAYVPSVDQSLGHLLFLRGTTTLMAQPFDARRLSLSGNPVRVVEEPIQQYLDFGLYSVSSSGALAFSPGTVESQLTWFDKRGDVLSTVGSPGRYEGFTLSPDGKRAIISRYETSQLRALWLLDLSRGTETRLELDRSTDHQIAIWAPDARSIIFNWALPGKMANIYDEPMSGTAVAQVLVQSNEWKIPMSLSPDGRFLLYQTVGGGTQLKLWLRRLEEHQKPVPFLGTEFVESDGRFSPDGRWVAYVTNESGRSEVYVRSFSPDHLDQGIANAADKWLISRSGGRSPVWGQDGKTLYYMGPDRKLMAVDIARGPVFQPSAPNFLFQAPPSGSSFGWDQWAPSPDRERFLFLVAQSQGQAPFTVVLNWQVALKQ
jgi:Tol biopolymer transport system component